jgi:hypothetical protein
MSTSFRFANENLCDDAMETSDVFLYRSASNMYLFFPSYNLPKSSSSSSTTIHNLINIKFLFWSSFCFTSHRKTNNDNNNNINIINSTESQESGNIFTLFGIITSFLIHSKNISIFFSLDNDNKRLGGASKCTFFAFFPLPHPSE